MGIHGEELRWVFFSRKRKVSLNSAFDKHFFLCLQGAPKSLTKSNKYVQTVLRVSLFVVGINKYLCIYKVANHVYFLTNIYTCHGLAV